MPDRRISQLELAAALAGTEEFPLVQGGVTKRAPVSSFAIEGHTHDIDDVVDLWAELDLRLHTSVASTGTTVERPVADRFMEIRSVEDYRDPGFTDIQAVNAAITAFNAGGMHLFFPAGTYDLTEPMTPITNGTGGLIQGCGSSTIIRVPSSASDYAGVGDIWVFGENTTGTTNRATHVTVRGFHINVAKSPLPDIDGVFVAHFKKALQCFVEHITYVGVAGLACFGASLGTASRSGVRHWRGTCSNGENSLGNVWVKHGASCVVEDIFTVSGGAGAGMQLLGKVTGGPGVATVYTEGDHGMSVGDRASIRQSLISALNETEVDGTAYHIVQDVPSATTFTISADATAWPSAITVASTTASTRTITTSGAHGLSVDQRIYLEGTSVAANNGLVYAVASVPTPTTLTIVGVMGREVPNSGTSQVFFDSTGGTITRTFGTVDRGGAILRIDPPAGAFFDTLWVHRLNSQIFDGVQSLPGKPFGVYLDRTGDSLTNLWIYQNVFDHTSVCGFYFRAKGSGTTLFTRFMGVINNRMATESGKGIFIDNSAGGQLLGTNIFANVVGTGSNDPGFELYSPGVRCGVNAMGNQFMEHNSSVDKTYAAILNGKGFSFTNNIILNTAPTVDTNWLTGICVQGADSDDFVISGNVVHPPAAHLSEPGDPGNPTTAGYSLPGSLNRTIVKPTTSRTVKFPASATYSNSTTTMTAIPGLQMWVEAGKTYHVRCILVFRSTDLAQGASFTFASKTGGEAIASSISPQKWNIENEQASTAASTIVKRRTLSSSFVGSSTGVDATGSDMLAEGVMIITPVDGGAFQVLGRPESAAATLSVVSGFLECREA